MSIKDFFLLFKIPKMIICLYVLVQNFEWVSYLDTTKLATKLSSTWMYLKCSMNLEKSNNAVEVTINIHGISVIDYLNENFIKV